MTVIFGLLTVALNFPTSMSSYKDTHKLSCHFHLQKFLETNKANIIQICMASGFVLLYGYLFMPRLPNIVWPTRIIPYIDPQHLRPLSRVCW